MHPHERESYKSRTLASRGRTSTFLTRHGTRWIRETLKCAGTHNVADALTKSLPRPAFHKHREFLKGTAQSFSAFFAGLSHKKGQSFLLQSPFEVYWWIMFISIATGGARSRLSHEPNRSKPARTKTEKYRFYFIKDGWGAEGSSYKHHSVSQRTDCLVPSQVCSNSVKGHWD